MKIAIVGTGIAGMGAAYLLHPHHDIWLYEKNDYVGGHTRTVDVLINGKTIPVDTGFIVFNYRNYPLFGQLLKHLKVPVQKSNMSFGVKIADGWLEYSSKSLFAQKINLIRPAFWKMLRDILYFNKKALQYQEVDFSISLGQILDELKLGDWFRYYYLFPMAGCIWSSPVSAINEFPAQILIQFFQNHGLLTVKQQPQWYTVTGGSRTYVRHLTESYQQKIKLNCGVERVIRENGKITLLDSCGEPAQYEQVIFACHADQALRLLDKPSQEEQQILGAFRYQPNRMILHRDISFMPKQKRIWPSWTYLLDTKIDKRSHISLSYWMNQLQNLEPRYPLIITLNPERLPQEQDIYDDYWFEHPVFDATSIQAQVQLKELQGIQNTWYCGAYHGYGFHEEGLSSAIDVAQQLGGPLPWS